MKNNFEKLNPSIVNAQVMELAAIWTDTPLEIVRNGQIVKNCVRIVAGDEVRIENLKLVNYGLTTHRIIRCLGNINNSFLMIEVESIINSEVKFIVILLES